MPLGRWWQKVRDYEETYVFMLGFVFAIHQ